MWKPRKVEPTVVRTPLPSAARGHAAAAGKAGAGATSANAPFVRAENEDDDGYDPYSDRQPEQPFFEDRPWD
ncbi:MAG: hypothetical protein Q4E12_05490 [Coriobacteriia bacterium]|nr:hypothetical protein [Coriobacteriia bacterium]